MPSRGHKPRSRTGPRFHPGEPAPPPIYHHPVIAVSLIFTVGAFAQMAIWLASARIAAGPVYAPTLALIHGWLYETLTGSVMHWLGAGSDHHAIIFGLWLFIGLGSLAAWYLAIRLALGPAWGLWTSLIWAAHPAFAFPIQRPSPLTAVVFLVPVVLLGLVWFAKSGRWILAPVVAGLALGALMLCGTIGLFLLPVSLLAVAFTKRSSRRRVLGSASLLAAFAGVVLPWMLIVQTPEVRADLSRRLARDWWSRLPFFEPKLAEKAKVWPVADGVPTSPLRFAAVQTREHPIEMTARFARRVVRTLYATADGRLERPLLAVQLALLIPALWGFRIALLRRPWRRVAYLAAAFVAIGWLLAATIEPLARNLTPVEAIGVMFALVGLADLYERTFGRRLGREPRGRRKRSLA